MIVLARVLRFSRRDLIRAILKKEIRVKKNVSVAYSMHIVANLNCLLKVQIEICYFGQRQ